MFSCRRAGVLPGGRHEADGVRRRVGASREQRGRGGRGAPAQVLRSELRVPEAGRAQSLRTAFDGDLQPDRPRARLRRPRHGQGHAPQVRAGEGQARPGRTRRRRGAVLPQVLHDAHGRRRASRHDGLRPQVPSRQRRLYRQHLVGHRLLPAAGDTRAVRREARVGGWRAAGHDAQDRRRLLPVRGRVRAVHARGLAGEDPFARRAEGAGEGRRGERGRRPKRRNLPRIPSRRFPASTGSAAGGRARS